jgi:hypothetical protein
MRNLLANFFNDEVSTDKPNNSEKRFSAALVRKLLECRA